VLEANPRASRTVPLVSKVCGIQMVPLAVGAIMSKLTNQPSPLQSLHERVIPYWGVKEAVFPFNMFQEVDPVLGPEMRSTGEVLGHSVEAGEAFFKAEEAANSKLPLSGTVLIAVSDSDKKAIVPVAQRFVYAGFKIIATEGTYEALKNSGVECENIGSGRPNAIDRIINGDVQMIVNTPREKAFTRIGSDLRRGAVKANIPYVTTIAAASAAIEGIMMVKAKGTNLPSLKSIKEWHNLIH
ncbi:MAG: hypothetical protein IJL01_09410, partial [Synergistaceae bacterium]|nr:hypothetical protein [Synergistaceae bacterium]